MKSRNTKINDEVTRLLGLSGYRQQWIAGGINFNQCHLDALNKNENLKNALRNAFLAETDSLFVIRSSILSDFSKLDVRHLGFFENDSIRNLVFPQSGRALLSISDFQGMERPHVNLLKDSVVIRNLICPPSGTALMEVETFKRMRSHHLKVLSRYDFMVDWVASSKSRADHFLLMEKFHLEVINDDALRKMFFKNQSIEDPVIESFVMLKQHHVEALYDRAFRSLVFPRGDGDVRQEDLDRLMAMSEEEINAEKQAYYLSVAEFFKKYHNEICDNPSSPLLNDVLSAMKPEIAGRKIKSILDRMHGYDFGREQLETTLGFEIEYSGVPRDQKKLLEKTMSVIQDNWDHPGDGTLRPENASCYCGEATSPVLSDGRGMRMAFVNIAFLQAMEGSANESCGFHVHVGLKTLPIPERFNGIDQEKYKLEFIRNFILAYKREEVNFRSVERPYNIYTKEIKTTDITDAPDIKSLMALIQDDRYSEINLHANEKHGTLEVRRFAGSADNETIYRIVSLVNALVEEAKERTNDYFGQKILMSEEVKPESVAQMDVKTDGLLSSGRRAGFFGYTPAAEKTQIRRELFMLDPNPLRQSRLENASLDEKEDGICCRVVDADGKATDLLLHESEHIKGMMEKLRSGESLTEKDRNFLLLELAREGHAVVIGDRVEMQAGIFSGLKR